MSVKGKIKKLMIRLIFNFGIFFIVSLSLNIVPGDVFSFDMTFCIIMTLASTFLDSAISKTQNS